VYPSRLAEGWTFLMASSKSGIVIDKGASCSVVRVCWPRRFSLREAQRECLFNSSQNRYLVRCRRISCRFRRSAGVSILVFPSSS